MVLFLRLLAHKIPHLIPKNASRSSPYPEGRKRRDRVILRSASHSNLPLYAMLVILLAMFFALTAGVYPSGRVQGSAKGGRAPMVPFPLSRSPHPSSGPFPTYRKPARPAPPGRAAQRLAKRLRCSGLPRGRFFVLRAAPASARYNPFRVWRRGASCAAAPAYHPAGSFPFTAAPFRPPPPKRRGGGSPSCCAHPSISDTTFFRLHRRCGLHCAHNSSIL